MRQVIDKTVFDWSRSENKRVLAKGAVAMAILSHQLDSKGNIVSNGSTRCVWDNLQSRSDSKYLKRRVWAG